MEGLGTESLSQNSKHAVMSRAKKIPLLASLGVQPSNALYVGDSLVSLFKGYSLGLGAF